MVTCETILMEGCNRMSYRTLDYDNLNFIIHKRHLKFKHDYQLSEYFRKHPNLVAKAMTRPLPFKKALIKAIQFFIPELRPSAHTKIYCKFHKRTLELYFYIQNANLRKSDYWMRLNNDIQHSQYIPFYRITSFLHRTKPAWFNLYLLWQRHHVYIYYINKVNNYQLHQKMNLYYVGSDTKRHQHKVVLSQELKNNRIKNMERTDIDDVALYDINHKRYYIYSPRLLKKVTIRQ